jgi:RND family efflux transporter MFP subunit
MDDVSNVLAALRINREAPVRRRPRWWVGALTLGVIGLLALGGWAGYGRLQAAVFKTEVRITEVASVSPIDDAVSVTSTGYVIPQLSARIGAPRPGRLIEVRVREGSFVKRGQVVARLDEQGLRAAVRGAEARTAAAQARVGSARAAEAEVAARFTRTQKLASEGAAPRTESEDLGRRLEVLRAATQDAIADSQVAAADQHTAQATLRESEILAPFDGVVVGKPLEVGDVVGPTSAPVAELVDMNSLVVETDVPEARVQMVAPGARCEIVLDAAPDKRLRGTVVQFGRKVNRAKATLTVRARFDDRLDLMVPEMAARVKFLADPTVLSRLAEPPVLVVPRTALVTRGDRSFVYVVAKERVKLTSVVVARERGELVELAEGPSGGVRVVSHPPETLLDGAPIKERAN